MRDLIHLRSTVRHVLTRAQTVPHLQLPAAIAGAAVVAAGAKVSRRQLLGLVWRSRPR